MPIKETSQIGNKVIRAKAKSVSNFESKKFHQVIKNLVDSMRKHELVGMAAPQIGESLRIFVTEVRKTKFRKNSEVDKLRIFINPKIKQVSKKAAVGWEGCGSVAEAGLFAKVKRPYSIEIEALNEDGEKFSFKAKGFLGRVIQHEIDHLNGIVFTDKADIKSAMSRSEFLKLRKS